MTNKIEKWEKLSSKTVFEKYSRRIKKVVFRLQGGQEVDYYLKDEGNVVAMLALTDDNKVILTRQFRSGPDEILQELPGGVIDKGEDVKLAAERELLEETGYKGDAKLVTGLVDCGYSTRKKHCVVVTNCKKVTKQDLDSTEFIRPLRKVALL